MPKDQLKRCTRPAGLDLGKTTHEEMAVAILAELVQLRASGAFAEVPAPRVEQQRAELATRAGLRSELTLAEPSTRSAG